MELHEKQGIETSVKKGSMRLPGIIPWSTAAKKTFFNDKINGATDARKLFSTFKTLLYPPPPPPATNLTADNFASFFTEKVAAIGKQFDQLSPPLRVQPSMAHHFLLSSLSARVRSPKS